MILYVDTSALIKRYFKEPYSQEVISRWNAADGIITSSVAYAETLATIYRKQRDADLNGHVVDRIISAFKRDWEGLIRVEVTNDLNGYIDQVVRKHPLRGFDAIHLASALIVDEKLSKNVFFDCFDQRLSQAAKLEGFEIFFEA